MTLPLPGKAPDGGAGAGTADSLFRLPADAAASAPAGPASAVGATALLRVTCAVPGWRTVFHMPGN